MRETLYLITVLAIPVTVLLVFGMKYVSAARQAHARALADAGYRELAEKTAALQAQATASLATIETQVADMAARLIAVEKILKEVG